MCAHLRVRVTDRNCYVQTSVCPPLPLVMLHGRALRRALNCGRGPGSGRIRSSTVQNVDRGADLKSAQDI
eukprot:351300-Chlamydomonas_euryale.AAC.3